MYYVALGKIFGMATLYAVQGQNTTLPVCLASALLKFMVDQPINAEDVRALDPDYFRNRMELMLQQDGLDTMKMVLGLDEMHFVEIDDASGLETEWELKPGGKAVEVTEENKREYVALLSEHYLCGSVRKEISEFLTGFHELVPLAAMRAAEVTEKDLGLIITGVPTINVRDWREHCLVEQNSQATAAAALLAENLIDWWWEVIDELSTEERAKVLQFTTGLSRVPAGGFKHLRPPFKITLNLGIPHTRLPTAHTCFNTLDLAPYPSAAVLKQKLALAVNEGAGGFALR